MRFRVLKKREGRGTNDVFFGDEAVVWSERTRAAMTSEGGEDKCNGVKNGS